jgi:hypothetical protein
VTASTLTRWIAARALAAALLAVLPGAAWASDADRDIVVRVHKDGPTIAVSVDCPVDASRLVVWEVLTDYDHMAQFLSNLDASSVTADAESPLRIHQKGRVGYGLLTFHFENIRDIELVPHREIRSRSLGGDAKASDFTTRIVEVAGAVHIVNSGRYTPGVWIPPFIGPAVIEAEVRRQFGDVRREILRRDARIRPQT